MNITCNALEIKFIKQKYIDKQIEKLEKLKQYANNSQPDKNNTIPEKNKTETQYIKNMFCTIAIYVALAFLIADIVFLFAFLVIPGVSLFLLGGFLISMAITTISYWIAKLLSGEIEKQLEQAKTQMGCHTDISNLIRKQKEFIRTLQDTKEKTQELKNQEITRFILMNDDDLTIEYRTKALDYCNINFYINTYLDSNTIEIPLLDLKTGVLYIPNSENQQQSHVMRF